MGVELEGRRSCWRGSAATSENFNTQCRPLWRIGWESTGLPVNQESPKGVPIYGNRGFGGFWRYAVVKERCGAKLDAAEKLGAGNNWRRGCCWMLRCCECRPKARCWPVRVPFPSRFSSEPRGCLD